MKNILYLLNIDWRWIKQRPQFIAEGLDNSFNVHVIYQHRYTRNGMKENKNKKVKVTPIYVLPRGDRAKLTLNINEKIKKIMIRNFIARDKTDIIYATLPNQYKLIPLKYKGVVVYDCMDNHPAFYHNKRLSQSIIDDEKRMITRADIVFVSSMTLMRILRERYGHVVLNKMRLIRNGYTGSLLPMEEEHVDNQKKTFTITYFGTISNWFNFDFILRSLVDFPNIRYELFGPIDGVRIPVNSRIVYRGVVRQKDLADNVKNTDCFIMPFIVNNLVKAVDPVKIYEYINFNKNIISSWYPEIDRFKKFVYFYSDYDSFCKQLRNVTSVEKVLYSKEERKTFLSDNHWNVRVKQIVKEIDATMLIRSNK